MGKPTQEFREALADVLAKYQAKFPTVRDVTTATGISHTTIYNWQRGRDSVTVNNLMRLHGYIDRADLVRLFVTSGEGGKIPAPLLDDTCPPYCERANALAQRLGITKDEAIGRALDLLAAV